MSVGAHTRDLLGWVHGFGRREGGLVTVEWLALAGAVVIGGITVVWLTLNGLQNSAQSIGSTSCHQIPAQLRGQLMADCVHAQNSGGKP